MILVEGVRAVDLGVNLGPGATGQKDHCASSRSCRWQEKQLSQNHPAPSAPARAGKSVGIEKANCIYFH